MTQINKRVFILGAGFSKCCGMPLGKDLFAQAFYNIDADGIAENICQHVIPFSIPSSNLILKIFQI